MTFCKGLSRQEDQSLRSGGGHCKIDGDMNAVDILDGPKPVVGQRALRDVTLILIGCTALFDSDVLVRWPNWVVDVRHPVGRIRTT